MELVISWLLSRKLSLTKSQDKVNDNITPGTQPWQKTPRWWILGNAAKIKFGLGFCHLALGEFWMIHDRLQPKATSFHVTNVGF